MEIKSNIKLNLSLRETNIIGIALDSYLSDMDDEAHTYSEEDLLLYEQDKAKIKSVLKDIKSQLSDQDITCEMGLKYY